MPSKCIICGDKDNYNFVINNGKCNSCIEGYIENLECDNTAKDERIKELEGELAKEKAMRGSIKSSHFRIKDSGTVAIGTCGELNCYPSRDDMVKIYTNADTRGVYFTKHTIQDLITYLGQVRNHMFSPAKQSQEKKKHDCQQCHGHREYWNQHGTLCSCTLCAHHYAPAKQSPGNEEGGE